jgi:hypothetical protein
MRLALPDGARSAYASGALRLGKRAFHSATRAIHVMECGRLLVGIALVVAVTSLIGVRTLRPTVPVAAKSEDGHTSSASNLSLVLLNSTDGQPHLGQNVTFNISTTATNEPYVSLNCYQNGGLVYGAMAGFFPSYLWPGSQIFPLSSPSWTSGAASCTATLYYVNGKKNIMLTTLNFQVFA